MLNIQPGDVFGRLTVIGRGASRPGKGRFYLCKCECGTEKTLQGAYLGKTTSSCGCLRRESFLNSKRGRTHGMSESREYCAWKGMRRRCNASNATSFRDYAGRGIKVCQAWQNSFEEFLRDMGPSPSALHSLDRIDNDGNYEPGNCRWATKREQTMNRRPVSQWGGRREQGRKLKERISQLEAWIEEEGKRTDVCTRLILRKVCSGCRCGRAEQAKERV